MANILVVDDDRMTCHLLMSIIKGAGHNVSCVYNLTECLSQVADLNPDVIMLDLTLPDGNGLGHIARTDGRRFSARSDHRNRNRRRKGVRSWLFKSGAWDFVTKPFQPNDVLLPPEPRLAVSGRKSRTRTQPILFWREGHHWLFPPDQGLPGTGGPGGQHRHQRSRHRRDRNRQGTLRPGHSQKQPTRQGELCRGGLYVPDRDPGGEYSVRSSERGFSPARKGPGPALVKMADRGNAVFWTR